LTPPVNVYIRRDTPKGDPPYMGGPDGQEDLTGLENILYYYGFI
jgi:hypothetical protein